MPIKQQYIDMKAIEDYSSINRQIEENALRLRRLHETVGERFKDSSNNLIRLDFIHMLDSIDYIQKSCASVYYNTTGIGNHFIPYTTFYREILSTIKQIMMKVSHFHKKQLKIDKKASVKYNGIQQFLAREIKWRNKSEHDIDPFYGDHEEVLRVFSIDKMLSFIEMVMDLLDDLNGHQVDLNPLEIYAPMYNGLSLLQRKQLLHGNKESALRIFSLTTELSYKVMEIRPDEELTILLNLAMKYLEVSRCLKYTYSMDNELPGSGEKEYAYFARLGLTFIYQFYDKLGLFVKHRYSIATKTTYFKDNVRNVKRAINSSQQDEILMSCIDIEESDEYGVLNDLRQAICHKNKWVDYQASSESVSTLIVLLFITMTDLMELILCSYFEKWNIKLSLKATEEAYNRTNSIKL
ncbi:hypothetical protein [Paenibacillus xylaniclasticus]|uniref:hypothetical protein n=1 Tax=Paenibacillus xylaniclasticus TaxID=588083 RepID=UPI000FD88948|nr:MULTISPECIES: hypothetical protein [Paenibacillus]GFN33727.1 hypothetical protein PCURB6_39870 [Paenibacillus curdlanolyticus]